MKVDSAETMWKNILHNATHHTNGCITTHYAPGKYGYPNAQWRGPDGTRTHYGTHQFAYLMQCGDIPDGSHIICVCGNRSCIRADHLQRVDQFADITPYRQKLAQYMACGMSGMEVARSAGITTAVLYAILYSSNTKVRHDTAEKIDNMPPPRKPETPAVDPTVLRRILAGNKIRLPRGVAWRAVYVAALREHGWNNAQISRAIGVSNTTIHFIEDGTPTSSAAPDAALAALQARLTDAQAETTKWRQAYEASLERETRWRTIAVDLKRQALQ